MKAFWFKSTFSHTLCSPSPPTKNLHSICLWSEKRGGFYAMPISGLDSTFRWRQGCRDHACKGWKALGPRHDELTCRGRDWLREESVICDVLTPRTPCSLLILGPCRTAALEVGFTGDTHQSHLHQWKKLHMLCLPVLRPTKLEPVPISWSSSLGKLDALHIHFGKGGCWVLWSVLGDM